MSKPVTPATPKTPLTSTERIEAEKLLPEILRRLEKAGLFEEYHRPQLDRWNLLWWRREDDLLFYGSEPGEYIGHVREDGTGVGGGPTPGIFRYDPKLWEKEGVLPLHHLLPRVRAYQVLEKWSCPFPIHYNLHKDFGARYTNDGSGRIVPLDSQQVHDLARFCGAWRVFRMAQRLECPEAELPQLRQMLDRPLSTGYKVGDGFVIRTPGLGTGTVHLEPGHHHFIEEHQWVERLAQAPESSMGRLLPLWSPE